MRVLIVDDDHGVRRFITRVLERNGMQGEEAADSDAARRLLKERSGGPFDVILLDVSMPGQTGWDFMEELRHEGDETPVIFLTGHHTVEDRVKGLELGADDYVLKPFASSELVARIEAVVRRRQSLPILNLGSLRIDLARRVVEIDGKRVDVSPREFAVLGELVQANGKVISKRELLRRVWGIDFDPGTKVVEVQVARLRRKLERAQPSLIQTVIGEGYRLVVPE